MKISWAITAYNEVNELKLLLDQLIKNISKEDEIIVQLDNRASEEMRNIFISYGFKFPIKLIEYSLNNDFASFKNNLKLNCTGEYIVFIDADENLTEYFIKMLPQVLSVNQSIECFALPRINTVDMIGLSHVQKWGWSITKGRKRIKKELDLNNPRDLDHYKLLERYNLIINEE